MLWPGPDYPLCRLYHGRGPPSQGGPRRSAAKFLSRCFDVWTLSVRLNVTTKKGRQLFWEKSAPPQIRISWLRVREKGPRQWQGKVVYLNSYMVDDGVSRHGSVRVNMQDMPQFWRACAKLPKATVSVRPSVCLSDTRVIDAGGSRYRNTFRTYDKEIHFFRPAIRL